MLKSILIIDDEEILIRALTALLKRQGHKILPALGGEAGIRIAETEDFDIVISDMRMPGLNGVDTISQIRVLKPDIPVIFVTGFADEKLEAQAQFLKPIGYLHKPFDAEKLLELLR